MQAAVTTTTEAAGARQVAARLAALEAALPLAALRTGEWAPWAAWRRTLAHAESAAVLAALVRPRPLLIGHPMLGYQHGWACGTYPQALCTRLHVVLTFLP
jgi:hypothetical protein